MERFTNEEMIHLVAYQNLYGPITPERFDLLFARLGMDVAAPHMKKGKKPKLKDHLLRWSRNSTPRKTPRQLLAAVKGIQSRYEQTEKAKARREKTTQTAR